MARLAIAAVNDPGIGEGSSYCWQPSLAVENNVSSSFLDAAWVVSLALCLGPDTSLLRDSGEWVRTACADSSCCIQCPGPVWEAFLLEWGGGLYELALTPASDLLGLGGKEVDKRKWKHSASMQVPKNSKWIIYLSVQSCYLAWSIPYSLFSHPQTLEGPTIISIQVFHK